jgi:putative oxidoreductase
MKNRTSDAASLVLRIAVGLIFIPHGWSKVFGAQGVAGFAQDLPSYHLPVFLGYAAAYSEFLCGFLLIAGLLTRIDAFLLGCTMFVAAFVVQMPDALHDPDNAGKVKFFAVMRAIELPFALLAACVALVLIGAGRWSVDGAVRASGERRAASGKRSASGSE